MRQSRTSGSVGGPGGNSRAYPTALDRAKSMVYPDATQVLYAYDDASRLVGLQDPAGSHVAFGYDDRGLETSRVITRGTGVLGTTSETRVYDPLGRLLVAEDDDSKVTMTWAVLGLQSLPYEERQEYVSATPLPRTVRKTFDAVGNKQTELYPSGLSLSYTWNSVNRLQTIFDGTNTIASFTFVGHRKKTATFQSGATETRTYSGFREEITRVHHQTSGAQTILDLQYAYNKVHDRLFERFGGAGSVGDAFAYDRLRRLTNAWMGSANPAAPTGATYVQKIDYNYSDDGNRNSVVVTPFGGAPVSTSYTANNLNQYTLVGAAAQASDGNGNLKDDGSRLFSYDYRNQLVKVTTKSTGQTIATYRHDAMGRRIEKDVVGGAKERYVYSGLETISTETTSGTWKQDFVFGEGIDEIVMLEQADILDHDGDQNTTELTRHFYHRNALGSVMDLSDMLQAVAVSYRYTPYGKPTITRNGQPQTLDPLGQHWSFTARFFDEETSLFYYRARTYDPVTGRFLQRDPVGYAPAPALYEFVASRPTMLTDPLGLVSLFGPSSAEHLSRDDARAMLDSSAPKDNYHDILYGHLILHGVGLHTISLAFAGFPPSRIAETLFLLAMRYSAHDGRLEVEEKLLFVEVGRKEVEVARLPRGKRNGMCVYLVLVERTVITRSVFLVSEFLEYLDRFHSYGFRALLGSFGYASRGTRRELLRTKLREETSSRVSYFWRSVKEPCPADYQPHVVDACEDGMGTRPGDARRSARGRF